MKTKTTRNLKSRAKNCALRFTNCALLLAVLFGLFAAIPQTAGAVGAADLANQINGFNHGGAGTLKAVANGDTVTVTSPAPVTGATKWLGLDINAGVTVKWKAKYSGATNTVNGLIKLSGGGVFEVAPGGNVISGGSWAAIYVVGTNTVNISGTVEAVNEEPAIRNDSAACTVNVNGGTVKSASCAIFTGSNTTVNVNSGAVSSSNLLAGTRAIEVRGTSVLNVKDGTVSALNAYAVYAMQTSSVNVSGGTVFSETSTAIRGTDPGVRITVTGGTVHGSSAISAAGCNIELKDGLMENAGVNSTIYLSGDSTLAMSGGTVIARGKNAMAIYADASSSKCKIAISGGLVTSDEYWAIFNESKKTEIAVSGGAAVWANGTNGRAIRNAGEEVKITVSGGTVECRDKGIALANATAGKKSEITVSGGSVKANGTDSCAVYNSAQDSKVTVKGGSVESPNRCIYNDGASSSVTVSGGAVTSTGSMYTVSANAACGVVVSGNAVVKNTGSGDTIMAPLSENDVQIKGGTVTSNTGIAISAYTLTVSGGTVASAGAKNTVAAFSAEVIGGKVEANGTGTAIEAKAVEVKGGVVCAKTGFAAKVSAGGAVKVSGGFVFAYGSAITGTGNVVGIDSPPETSGDGVICAWNKPSGTPAYKEGESTDLIVNSGASAKWSKNGSQTGINYANTGFFPISGITLNAAVPATYTVTVTGGTGGGSYAAGAAVNIKANAATAGKVFDKWTASGVNLSAPGSANTSFIMPANSVTVTATYKDAPASTSTPSSSSSNPPAATYTVTVTNGTGGGSYAAGSTVNITANAAPAGKAFDKWITSDGVAFADAKKSGTSFTMPAKKVTVTATYKDLPTGTYAVNMTAGVGGSAYAGVTYAKPGDVVKITAVESEGYMFKKWDVVSGPVTLFGEEFTMPSNSVTIKAIFQPVPGAAASGAAQSAESAGTDQSGVSSGGDTSPGDETAPENTSDTDGDAASDATSNPGDSSAASSGGETDPGSINKGGNTTLLWILLIFLAVTAISSGIAFFLIKMKGES